MSKTIEEKANDFFKELNRAPTQSIVEYAFKKGYELAQSEVNKCVIPDVSKSVCEICGSNDEHKFDNPSCDCYKK